MLMVGQLKNLVHIKRGLTKKWIQINRVTRSCPRRNTLWSYRFHFV